MKNIEVEDALERYADMIYRIALIHCAGVREDAEDVFQEVFLILLRRRMGFREEEHRKAWLIRVTLNQCKKKHHGRQRMIPMDHEILYAKLEEDQKEERKEQELSEVAERAGLSAAELEHLKLYGRETKVNEKAEYRIGYRKAYITFWSRIRLSDEDNTVTVSEMKISYTFERLDGCWKISGTNIEAI